MRHLSLDLPAGCNACVGDAPSASAPAWAPLATQPTMSNDRSETCWRS